MAPQKLPDMIVMRGMVLNDHGEMLVAQRAQSCSNGSQWEFPGGKLDAHEAATPLSGLQREIFEETGVRAEFLGDLIAHTDVTQFPDNGRIRRTAFVIGHTAIYQASFKLQTAEVMKAAWVPPKEIARLKLVSISRAALEVYLAHYQGSAIRSRR